MSVDWAFHQKELDNSDESLKSYCDRLGINYGTGRKKLKKKAIDFDKNATFAKQRNNFPEEKKEQKEETEEQICREQRNKRNKFAGNKGTTNYYDNNTNALKHGGYARKLAENMLEGEEHSNSFEREIAIFEQQVDLLLRQQILCEQEGDKELLMKTNEALNRTTARLMALKVARQRFKKSINGNLELLNNLLKKKDNEELTATEVAYKLTKRGIDIPAILMLEVKAEQGEYEEEEHEIPSFSYHDIVKREEELRNQARQNKEEFLAQRRKELAALDEEDSQSA